MDEHTFHESEMALFFECMLWCAQKLLDIADIVREAIYHQSSRPWGKLMLDFDNFAVSLWAWPSGESGTKPIKLARGFGPLRADEMGIHSLSLLESNPRRVP